MTEKLSFEDLKKKASFSSMSYPEDLIATYKGAKIVKDERGFTSRDEVDQFLAYAFDEIKFVK